MAAVARYLVDTSVFARHHYPEVGQVLDPLITSGVVATCGVLEFEVLYSARGPREYAELARARRTTLEWLPTEDVDVRRGLEVQSRLAQRSQHRIAWPDLIIAAIAERYRVTILHYDADYDRIAKITGQQTEWAVPKGSVP
jgi:predicted nucleic acid-binding protein